MVQEKQERAVFTRPAGVLGASVNFPGSDGCFQLRDWLRLFGF